MSEKTEQPTAKKLEDARKKGNVAQSRDASGVGAYVAGVALLGATAATMARISVAAQAQRALVRVVMGMPCSPLTLSHGGKSPHRSLPSNTETCYGFCAGPEGRGP